MKNIKLLITLILLITVSTISAQEMATSSFTSQYPRAFKGSNRIVIKNAFLGDGSYIFNSKKQNVLITIKDGFYTENYDNKEFVKAKINWISEYIYKLEIVAFNKANFKLKVGSKIISEITDVTDEKYSYQTKLKNGRVYKGKLLKLEDENTIR